MIDYPKTRMAERRRRHQARIRRVKLFLLFALISAAAFLVGFNYRSNAFIDNITEKINIPAIKSEVKILNRETPLLKGDHTTIMLMGVDQRKDDVGRSDTLMVVSLDSKDDRVSLLSIPRDTRVKIKRHGYDKINAAYAYGGYKLSQSTVENFLGVKIDH